MAWDVCIEIPALPDPLELMLPGGISIKHLNLDQLLQPALAPLGPVFTLLESVTALLDVLTSFQAALGTGNVVKAAKTLGKLASIPPNLAKLAPPVAIPILIVGCVDVLLRTLQQVRSEVLQLQQQIASLAHVERMAHQLGDVRLLNVFECSKHNIEQEAANVGKGMASVGHLLGVINLVAKLGGVGVTVPALDDLSGQPLRDALAPFDALITALQGVRRAIPVPS